MRGFGFEEHGGLDRLRFVDIGKPEPGPGEVRVRLRAAAFNRLDRFTLTGIPGVTVARPHVLGSDGAGTIDRLGDGAEAPAVGSPVLLNPGVWDGSCAACRRGEEALCRDYRIVGEHLQGTATEFAVVPARNVRALPERLTFVEGAVVPLVFQTAWRALSTVGEVRPGMRVALIGAGGGVATAALQVAKLLGATVCVAARDRVHEEASRKLGADEFVVFGEEAPLDRGLWTWSQKQGVDVIFDPVGAPTLGRSLRAVARGGRVVVIGATAGPQVELDVRTLFWRQASIRGSTMASASEFEAVLAHLAGGRLRPVVDSVYRFEEAVAAFHRFDTGRLFGKVALEMPAAGSSDDG